MRISSFVLGAASLGIVLVVFLWEAGRTAPGPLSAAHRGVAALRGGEACDRCHVGGGAPALAGCGGCHDAVALDLRERRGFHGTMTHGEPTACADCHVEHRGDDLGLVTATSYRKAGFEHPASFPLVAAHEGLACVRCHGERPRSTPEPTCATCHRDRRPRGATPDHLATGFPEDCARCHRPTRWADATFAHRFPIRQGDHAGLSCAACHTPPRGLAAYSCVDCHEHARGEMAKKHRKVRGYEYASPACFRCHPDGRERDD